MRQLVSARVSFDPAWYAKELADTAGTVLLAYVRDGVPVALCESYPLGMRITDGARLLSARNAFRADPDALEAVGNFCIRAGLIHNI